MKPPVDYADIRRSFDPFGIIPAGCPYPRTSVDYFILGWDVSVSTYDMPDSHEGTVRYYDIGEWLEALIGVEHAAHFLAKFSKPPDGLFYTRLGEDVFLASTTPDKRRWTATAVGCRAVAIALCSSRIRTKLDYRRVNQHANYIAATVALYDTVRYNEELGAAIHAFFDGERLEVWQDAIDAIINDNDTGAV